MFSLYHYDNLVCSDEDLNFVLHSAINHFSETYEDLHGYSTDELFMELFEYVNPEDIKLLISNDNFPSFEISFEHERTKTT